MTVLWFLLIINGMNFIDGLDGLAAGVCLISSMILMALSLSDGKYLIAFGLAAMGGSCLGFLRYNFNPARIFMGDSGSYFLGYILAGLSILGCIKSQASLAILVPIIALGLPLMDTLLSAVRRFANGQDIFQPDQDHVHHRLLRTGLSQRRAVIFLYAVAICLGIIAFYLVHVRDEVAGVIVLLVGTVATFSLHRLGYFRYAKKE